MTREPGAILDCDGTLVDSNYHHVLAWAEAFERHGVVVDHWRIHKHVGMGGDALVRTLLGGDPDPPLLESIVGTHEETFGRRLPLVRAFEGAERLIRALRERGHRVVLATAARAHELDRFLDLLDARDALTGWTGSADVDESKPEPDLVEAALETLGGGAAVMVGDSPWDVETGRRGGIETIGVLSGGFARQELVDAGAIEVYESVGDLADRIEDSAFGR